MARGYSGMVPRILLEFFLGGGVNASQNALVCSRMARIYFKMDPRIILEFQNASRCSCITQGCSKTVQWIILDFFRSSGVNTLKDALGWLEEVPR